MLDGWAIWPGVFDSQIVHKNFPQISGVLYHFESPWRVHRRPFSSSSTASKPSIRREFSRHWYTPMSMYWFFTVFTRRGWPALACFNIWLSTVFKGWCSNFYLCSLKLGCGDQFCSKLEFLLMSFPFFSTWCSCATPAGWRSQVVVLVVATPNSNSSNPPRSWSQKTDML